MTHNFTVRRSLPENGLQLWARCTCRHEIFARTYDDLAVLVQEHRDDARTLEQEQAEERRRA